MRNVAVVVDDVALNRDLLAEMLEDDFSVLEAADGHEALRVIEENFNNIAVVTLDLTMPGLDGLGVLKVLKERNWLDKFPVLVITGEIDETVEEACLLSGATDFIRKPFNVTLIHHRVQNSVSLFGLKNNLEEQVAAQTEVLRSQNKQLVENSKNIIELLGNVVEARNRESGTHLQRVKGFTRILGMCVKDAYPEYGLTKATVNLYAEASVMHDLGKIMISDTILLKPGKLTPEEFKEMERHTIYGCEVLDNSRELFNNDYYQMSRMVCRSHHEKWDGKGYPDGLAGDDIPLVAQLVSIADCYDALTSERPYKQPLSSEVAYNMILGGECGAFNPKLLDCFVRSRADFEKFVEETSEENNDSTGIL